MILKEGAKVKLVWNKSDTLKNGTMGVFVGMDADGSALVQFENEGTVKIGKETWNKTDEKGQKIGSVRQYPIILAYSITCHKAQGLTLDAVVVHCANEFVAGLIYVSSFKVRSASHIQMLNFKPTQLIKQPQEVIDMCSTSLGNPVEDLTCCRFKKMEEDFFHVIDRLVTVTLDTTEDYAFPLKYKTSIKYESSTKCLCGTNNMRDVQECKLKYKTLVKCFLELNVFVNLVFSMRKLNVEYELTNVEC